MIHAHRCQLAVALSVVCIPGFSLGLAAQEEASTASTTTPAAYVYVQTHQGVVAYSASSAGKLTKISGSPFGTTGQMAGNNGSYLISTGTDLIHSYKIESNGAVGPQASEINTQSYGGAQCGTTDGQGAKLDHTGKYFYVQLYGATYESSGEQDYLCAAWQSYKLNSSGQFTFLGDAESPAGYHGNAYAVPLETISSNDKFGYGAYYDVYATDFSTFSVNSNGELENMNNFTEKAPTASGPDNGYQPLLVAADPSGHLAVLEYEFFASNPPPPQLASFTITSTGGISSTNTYKNMPTPTLANCCGTMSMSISGKLLALTGSSGIQLFHFNGSSPITKYTSILLPTETVYYISWDKNNHMYALGTSGGTSYNLHVFNATSTSVSEVSGSPYSISNVYGLDGLIVVPK